MAPNGWQIELPSLFLNIKYLWQCNKNNKNNNSVLFTVCTVDHYYVNIGQISVQDSNTKFMQIESEFKFLNRNSKIRTLFIIPSLSNMN